MCFFLGDFLFIIEKRCIFAHEIAPSAREED